MRRILFVIFFFIICIRENYHCAPRAFWDFGNWNIPNAPFESRGYRPPKQTNVDEYDIFGVFPPVIITESSSETTISPSSIQTKTTGVSTQSISTETLPVTTTELCPPTVSTSESRTATETKPTTPAPTTTTTARKFDIREFIKLSFHNNCSSSTCTINIKRIKN